MTELIISKAAAHVAGHCKAATYYTAGVHVFHQHAIVAHVILSHQVLLHLWVMVILLTYSPEVHQDKFSHQ